MQLDLAFHVSPVELLTVLGFQLNGHLLGFLLELGTGVVGKRSQSGITGFPFQILNLSLVIGYHPLGKLTNLGIRGFFHNRLAGVHFTLVEGAGHMDDLGIGHLRSIRKRILEMLATSEAYKDQAAEPEERQAKWAMCNGHKTS